MSESIPYRQLETLFLDAGGTLVTVDFARVGAELRSRGVACTEAELVRAEAAARPVAHAHLGFASRIRLILERIDLALDPTRLEGLAAELTAVLEPDFGESDRFWCQLLPGVREALHGLHRLGLQLVVVSNADGSVERGLEARGIRTLLHEVVDSHVVGFEKPDPRIFEEALARSGAHPERTLHVGDMYHADVLGARAAGVHALLLDPFDDWGDVDCPRLPDLSALLRVMAAARDL